tara:strand:+ start:527 stop:1039 length:513 start_codon:yes stop_codon:yes gene_type:complete
MKKLLLLLLCVPLIGFGQYDEVDTKVTPAEETEEAPAYEVKEKVTEGELSLFGKIKRIHMSGGILFMSILSFMLLATLISFILFKNKNIVLLLGFISLLVGKLSTYLGVIGASDAILAAGDISTSLLMGGVSVAITTYMYGLIIFIISLILKVISLITLEFNKENILKNE